MTGIVVVFAAGAAGGFFIGYFYFHWLSIVASGLVIALMAAWILQAHGFSIVSGIVATVACLTVNQFAFLLGGMVKKSQETAGSD